MSTFIMNEQKMNEIIFANRNKSYGAYVLRSSYGETVLKSLALVLLGLTTIFSLIFYFSNKPVEEKSSPALIIHDSVYVITYGEEKVEKKIEPAENKTLESAKKDGALSSTLVKDSVATSTFSTEAFSAGNSTAVIEPGENGEKKGAEKVVGSGGTKKDEEIREPYAVDVLPEFEGGLNALYRLLGTHLRYPEEASIEGKEGVVFIKFIVDENGKVGSLKALNKPGYGLEEEALRVVGLIPKFKSPAMAAGHPVKVFYQLPIRFKIK